MHFSATSVPLARSQYQLGQIISKLHAIPANHVMYVYEMSSKRKERDLFY